MEKNGGLGEALVLVFLFAIAFMYAQFGDVIEPMLLEVKK